MGRGFLEVNDSIHLNREVSESFGAGVGVKQGCVSRGVQPIGEKILHHPLLEAESERIVNEFVEM